MSPRRGIGLVLAFIAAGGFAAPPAWGVFPGSPGRLLIDKIVYETTTGSGTLPYDSSFENDGPLHWPPDGGRLAGRLCQRESGECGVWIADVDSGAMRGLSTLEGMPVWSPDGRRIALARLNSRRLYVLDSSDGSVLQTLDVGDRGLTLQDWSPVRDEILAQRLEPDPADTSRTLATLVIVRLASGDVEAFRANRMFGSWSADGERAAVSGVPHQRSQPIEIVDRGGDVLESFERTQFHLDRSGLEPVGFSPDGWVTFADCLPQCGIWSRRPRRPDDPPGAAPQVRLELAGVEHTESAAFVRAVEWEAVQNRVAIASGPSGAVPSADALFEFAAPGGGEGRYECRLLERGSWGTCVSPTRYSGLPDGEHEFQVRFVSEGQAADEAPVSVRRWRSDTTPPVAIVTEAPSGAVVSTAATIAFHATEAEGASFSCTLDGGAAYDCSSPQRLAGLAPGEHVFTVRATDAVGNVQANATEVRWRVEPDGTPGPAPGPEAAADEQYEPLPASTGCGPGTGRVAIGVLVAVARAGSCFGQITHDGRRVRAISGPVTINGIQLTPAAGAHVVVDARLTDAVLATTGPTTVGVGPLSLTIPRAVRFPLTPGTLDTGARFVLPAVEDAIRRARPRLAGLPLAGAPIFELSAGDGGTTKVGLKLEVPAALRELPTPTTAGELFDENATGGLTLELTATASNDKGVSLAGRAKLQKAWLFGALELEDVGLGFDSADGGTFEGFGTLVLTRAPASAGAGERRPKFTLALSLGRGGAFGLLRRASLQASAFQRPIGNGFFLQRFGGEFAATTADDGKRTVQLSGNAGVSFGPRLEFKPVFEGEAVSLDAKAQLTVGDPVSLEFSGAGKIVEVPVAEAVTRFVSTGRVEMSGKVDFTLGGYGFLGQLRESWFDAARGTFNAESSAELLLPGLRTSSEAVISSTGFAVCDGPPALRLGIAKRWGAPLQVLAGACDVGPFRAATAQVAPGNEFAVRDGTGLLVLTVHGLGGAPDLIVAGPAGAPPIQTRSSAKTDAAMIVDDEEQDTTTVALRRPAPGRWTVTPALGSVPLAGILVAEALPPVQVHGRLFRTGSRRGLAWRLRPLPGQQVTFVEIGRDVARVLATTNRRRGRLRFRPAAGRYGRRTIVAYVAQDGLPRAGIALAKLRTPPAPRAGLVRGLRRRRGDRISWRRQRGVTRYAVALRTASGASRSLTVSRPALRLPASFRGVRHLTASIVALGPLGESGPATTRRITRE